MTETRKRCDCWWAGTQQMHGAALHLSSNSAEAETERRLIVRRARRPSPSGTLFPRRNSLVA
jgi:hypothetical protein